MKTWKNRQKGIIEKTGSKIRLPKIPKGQGMEKEARGMGKSMKVIKTLDKTLS
jgi:hypothetical protein